MRAVGYSLSLPIDHPDALLDIEQSDPSPTGHQILVRVEAVAVNPVDTKLRMRIQPEAGEYQVLGYDAAGVVEAVGDKVTLFQPGDQVWYAGAMDKPGSNAELQLVDERIVGRKPESLSFSEAAALPLTSMTAWELLFDRMRVARERTDDLLVIGGAGGVGSILIQLAKRLTKLRVIGTASRPETRDWVSKMGADLVIDHSKPLDQELKAVGIDSVRYIASLTNTGAHLPAIEQCIAPQGAMGLIDDPESLDILPFKRRSVSVHWEFMFTRPVFQTEDMVEQHKILSEVSAMVDRGELVTTLAEDFGPVNAANLKKAHQLIESGKARGKIVMTGFGY